MASTRHRTSRTYRIAADSIVAPVLLDGSRSMLDGLGWQETTGNDWTVYLSPAPPEPAIFQAAGRSRRLNHLWNIEVVTDRARLARTLGDAQARTDRRTVQGCYDFLPRTFVPGMFVEWREAALWNPDVRWIRRPRRAGAGTGGSQIVSDVRSAEPSDACVWQEVIETADPAAHVHRHYVLVTSLDPLIVYLYEARPSDGLDHHAAEIARIAVQTLLAAREPMLQSMDDHGIEATGCFALLALDVLIGDGGHGWLLDCLAGPPPGNDGTTGDDRGAASEDALRMAIATLDHDRRDIVAGRLPDARFDALRRRLDAEADTRGGFRRIFPSKDAIAWLACIDRLRAFDARLLFELPDAGAGTIRVRPNRVIQAPLGTRVGLFTDRPFAFRALDDRASAIWRTLAGEPGENRAAADGDRPTLDEAIDAATSALSLPRALVARATQELVASLLHAGWLTVLRREDQTPAASDAPTIDRPRPSAIRRLGWNDERTYRLMGWRFSVRYPGAQVEGWVHPLLAHLESARLARDVDVLDGVFEVIGGDRCGVADDTGRTEWCAKEMVAATLIGMATRRACRARGGIALFRAAVEDNGDGSILLVGDHPGDADRPRLLVMTDAGSTKMIRADDAEAVDMQVRLIVERRASSERGLEAAVVHPADALTRLFASDRDFLMFVDRDSVAALAAWITSIPFRVLTAPGDRATFA